MHAMLSIVYDNKLHLAPISSTPQRILDLGAGSGIWCIEMGDMYPSADILGVDLSANMPEWVPPNVHFEVEDEISPILDRDN
jgi:ubiquinone/menaquinone biosynthesis C-methylase UbiE